MKKITVWLSIVLCFLTLAGCSRTETGESSVRADGTSEENGASGGTETPEGTQPPDPPQLTGEYVPIAEFAEAPFIVFAGINTYTKVAKLSAREARMRTGY